MGSAPDCIALPRQALRYSLPVGGDVLGTRVIVPGARSVLLPSALSGTAWVTSRIDPMKYGPGGVLARSFLCRRYWSSPPGGSSRGAVKWSTWMSAESITESRDRSTRTTHPGPALPVPRFFTPTRISNIASNRISAGVSMGPANKSALPSGSGSVGVPGPRGPSDPATQPAAIAGSARPLRIVLSMSFNLRPGQQPASGRAEIAPPLASP
jgi:hypothetical protein